MRRREFIRIVGLSAAWPLIAHAQGTLRSMPLVGAIWVGDAASPTSLALKNAFSQGLRDNGYIEGRNIQIEDRFAGSDLEALRVAAEQLVHLNVDVILAGGTSAALAAKRVTQTIPIVGVSMADPVADGLVGGLARPGGNVTGNTFIGPELGTKRFQLLKEVIPAAVRFAGLQQPKAYSERTMQYMVSELEDKARSAQTDFRVFNASHPDEFDSAFEAMVVWHAEALVTFPSAMFYANFKRIVDLASRHSIPTIYVFTEAVHAGGLMCYGADIADLSRLGAKYVAKILQGAKPADLPVEQPTKFQFVINARTVKALGLTMPATLLATADEVIE